ncbi:uncharacterized protein [Henckelia pumila]|uniref:uncharacterized protein n=1 Tax=Henckelia pumila TaxID=405737 RepID=UPI003C6E4C9F
MNELTIPAMHSIYATIKVNLHCHNLWQLDGRPMSGDIGRGATRKAITFAIHISAARDRPKGFLQLAGGTNAHTVYGLKKEGLFETTSLPDSWQGSEFSASGTRLHPDYLLEALTESIALVGTVKCLT